MNRERRLFRKCILVFGALLVSPLGIDRHVTASSDGVLGIPTGCSAWIEPNDDVGIAFCSGGYGLYRVKIYCTGNLTVSGTWRSPGTAERSRAACPAGRSINSAIYQTQSGA